MTFRVSKYIQQPAWRVGLLHYVAKALGVLAHVEGLPIGSNRIYPRWFDRHGEGSREAGASANG